uniref:Uncharacterized protein n=1 Tax=Melopsittacus undulatus TaxID=13146 RepID=A0A8V5G815_MELUD
MSDGPWVGSWRPHRPRAPIAALYTSPGPKYGLPSSVGECGVGPERDVGCCGGSVLSRGGCGGSVLSGGGCGGSVLSGFGVCAVRVWGLCVCGVRVPPPRALPSGFFEHDPCRTRAPAFSFGLRAAELPQHRSPGPSAYHLPPMLGPHLVSKTSAPSYSMTGRSTVGSFYEDLCKNPGPGRYRTVDTDVYKHRAPRFSMVARNVPPGDKTAKPGPAAYSPQQVSRDPRGDRPQGVTFGIRHSEYLAPLIVDVPD